MTQTAFVALAQWLVQGLLLLFFLVSDRRMGLKLLPLVAAGLAGLALTVLLVSPLGPLLQTHGSLTTMPAGQSAFREEYLFSLPLLILMGACYLATGFVAGALARWRGGTYGGSAGAILLVLTLQQYSAPVFALIRSRAGLIVDRNSGVEPRLYLTMAVIWMVFIVISALGGRLGQAAGLARERGGASSARPVAAPGEAGASGSATSLTCPSCGTVRPAGEHANYCQACGARLRSHDGR